MHNNNKEFQTFGMPWEEEYGYVEAVKNGNTVWLSGQLGHDADGILFGDMQTQMEQTYANIQELLLGFNMEPDDIVEEVLYVMDIPSAFEARKKVGIRFYPDPRRIASTLIGVNGLALPNQLIEIKIVAKKSI